MDLHQYGVWFVSVTAVGVWAGLMYVGCCRNWFGPNLAITKKQQDTQACNCVSSTRTSVPWWPDYVAFWRYVYLLFLFVFV